MSANTFRNTIQTILNSHGLQSLASHPEFCVRLSQPGYLNLVIEHLGWREAFSVSHSTRDEWSGDTIRDPEIVFQYDPTGNWYPVEIQQDPAGLYRAKFPRPGYVDVNFNRDVMELVNIWTENLLAQGWDTDAVLVELVGECKNMVEVSAEGALVLR